MDQKRGKKGSAGILWWILWIAATIGSFFVSVAFWTPVINHRYGTILETQAAIMWVAAVFATWMILLLPLIVFMYRRVDKAYEDARLAREKKARQFRTILIDPAKRLLPPSVAAKIASWPCSIEGGHLVRLKLRDGTVIPHVFVQNHSEIIGLYNAERMTFNASEVSGAEPEDVREMASSTAANWLRLDGMRPPD